MIARYNEDLIVGLAHSMDDIPIRCDTPDEARVPTWVLRIILNDLWGISPDSLFQVACHYAVFHLAQARMWSHSVSTS
jgi:hypothetical protein